MRLAEDDSPRHKTAIYQLNVGTTSIVFRSTAATSTILEPPAQAVRVSCLYQVIHAPWGRPRRELSVFLCLQDSFESRKNSKAAVQVVSTSKIKLAKHPVLLLLQ